MRYLLALSFCLLCPLAQARVAAYYVNGAGHLIFQGNSLEDWSHWAAVTRHPDQPDRSPQYCLGVLYHPLVTFMNHVHEPLPPQLVFKNNLRIGDYYVFYPEEEWFGSYGEWFVMDRQGHMVHCFNVCYGGGSAFPLLVTGWLGLGNREMSPSWEHVQMNRQGDEVSIYRMDKNMDLNYLRVFSKGTMSIVTEPVSTFAYADWPRESRSPTIRQEELIPLLREFIMIQTGKSKAVLAQKDIALLLARNKQGRDDHQRKTVRYDNPPPRPRAPSDGLVPAFDTLWEPLSKQLGFPDATLYQQGKDSGPDPNRMTHCQPEWLEGLGFDRVTRLGRADASFTVRVFLTPQDKDGMRIVLAQCGTRELALEGLARMRLWQGELEEKALRARRKRKGQDAALPKPDPAVIAARTNVSDKLVGDYALYLKGSVDKNGNVSTKGMYGAVFFIRGTTAVCVIGEDPQSNTLPVARLLDRALWKMHSLGPEKREPRPWKPDEDEDKRFNDYLKAKGVLPMTAEDKENQNDETT